MQNKTSHMHAFVFGGCSRSRADPASSCLLVALSSCYFGCRATARQLSLVYSRQVSRLISLKLSFVFPEHGFARSLSFGVHGPLLPSLVYFAESGGFRDVPCFPSESPLKPSLSLSLFLVPSRRHAWKLSLLIAVFATSLEVSYLVPEGKDNRLWKRDNPTATLHSTVYLQLSPLSHAQRTPRRLR